MSASTNSSAADNPRVLIVAEHVSHKMGGEAARPLHYFRVMRSRGVDVRLLVHARTRDELRGLLSPEDFARAHFVPDTWLHKLLWRIGKPLPETVQLVTVGALGHLVTQIYQRREAKRLVREFGIDVVHEPIPISPKQPSMTFGVGAPVVIGPLNGGMTYPPAFGHMEGRMVRWSLGLSRFSAKLLNRLIPGKLQADTIIVSNTRTRAALPDGCRGRVVELVANAVDMSTWKPSPRYEALLSSGPAAEPQGSVGRPVRFVFLGRLVDFKMVDLLLEAFKPVANKHGAVLEIVGDGPERVRLQQIATNLGLTDKQVAFSGWMSPKDSAARLGEADALVFPSLRECGGAVVMEAMAVGLPVVAAAWGGPADYVGDDGSGMLVQPTTRASFVAGLTEAMDRLAASPELRAEMSRKARHRAITVFDWEARVGRVLEIYHTTIAGEDAVVGQAFLPASGGPSGGVYSHPPRTPETVQP